MILLTGATGYVGGRLLHALEGQGRPVRCLARRPEALRDRVGGTTEVVGGDVFDEDSMRSALEGVSTAYYLIHSMGDTGDFVEQDRIAAGNFARAAEHAGVRRIVYLGGLANEDKPLSDHMRSRLEVGEILRSSGVEVMEFRASIIIGSGSLSFEMIRALVERLPIMVTPRWVDVRSQPIAITDVIEYLVAALHVPGGGSRVFEIGGPDRVSYGDLMREYARQRGLRRLMIPVPVLSPRLSSLWLGLVTPLYARVGRKLIDSIRHPSIVQDESARKAFDIRPMGVREAIAQALRNEDRELAETRWSDALSSAGRPRGWAGVRFGSRIVDTRRVDLPVAPVEAFRTVERVGGETGWYFGDVLWRLRGFIDLLVGGVGMRRGRPDPAHVEVGQTLDFWRVEAVDPPRRLRLSAEMKVPGRAWLQFEIDPKDDGCALRQTAIFDPHGLAGLVYWYGLYPLHVMVFSGMLRGMAAATRHNSLGESRRPGPWKQVVGLLVSLLAVAAVAAAGGSSTADAIRAGWYETLAKPAWTPPDWVFGPAWTALYILMAVGAWLVWREGYRPLRSVALTVYGLQLVLNGLWSFLFFGLRNPALGMVDVALLVGMVWITTALFAQIQRIAGWLMLPYALWVTFALTLNAGILWLNR